MKCNIKFNEKCKNYNLYDYVKYRIIYKLINKKIFFFKYEF